MALTTFKGTSEQVHLVAEVLNERAMHLFWCQGCLEVALGSLLLPGFESIQGMAANHECAGHLSHC